MEANDVIDPYEAAGKKPVVLAKFNTCKISFVAQRRMDFSFENVICGVTPSSCLPSGRS
jgi:hypothetical protein